MLAAGGVWEGEGEGEGADLAVAPLAKNLATSWGLVSILEAAAAAASATTRRVVAHLLLQSEMVKSAKLSAGYPLMP